VGAGNLDQRSDLAPLLLNLVQIVRKIGHGAWQLALERKELSSCLGKRIRVIYSTEELMYLHPGKIFQGLSSPLPLRANKITRLSL
jgi:hypothetical protein